MKKIITLTLGLLLSMNLVFAQTEDHKWAIGLHAGKNEHSGDLGNSIFAFDKAIYGFGGVTINRYISPSFNLALEGTRGRYGRWVDWEDNFKGDKNDISLMAGYKLNNGYILPADSWFAPMIIAGPGIAFYQEVDHAPGKIDDEGIDLLLSYGLALRFQLYPRIAIELQSKFSHTNDNDRDLYYGDERDFIAQHSFGLIVGLGRRDRVEEPVEIIDEDEAERLREEEEARRRAEEEQRRLEEELEREEERRRQEELARQRAEEERLRLEEERRQEEAVQEVVDALDPDVAYVLFTVDGTEIRPAYHNVMEMVYQIMREHPDLRLKIHGHTDSTGTMEYNRGLAERRAQSAKDYLVNKGISANRIITEGYGEGSPRASNETEEGRRQNRRVMFEPVFD